MNYLYLSLVYTIVLASFLWLGSNFASLKITPNNILTVVLISIGANILFFLPTIFGLATKKNLRLIFYLYNTPVWSVTILLATLALPDATMVIVVFVAAITSYAAIATNALSTFIFGFCLILGSATAKLITDRNAFLSSEFWYPVYLSFFFIGFISVLAQSIRNLRLKYRRQKEQAEEERLKVEKAHAEIEKLNEFSKKINETTDLDDILDSVLMHVGETFPIDASSLYLVDKEANEMTYYRGIFPSYISSEKVAEMQGRRLRLDESGGMHYKVFQRRRAFYLPKFRTTGITEFDLQGIEKLDLTSLLIVPLLVQNEVIGLLDFTNYRTPMKLSKADIASISRFCEQIAGAIHSSSLLKQTEEARQKAEDERKKSEKMHKRLSTIGQMASTIVHDLKNPMGVIKGYVELAGDEDTSKEERQEYLDVIDEEVNRLSDMAFDILDFAKGDVKLNIQNHSLKEYMNEIYKFLKPNFEESNIELKLQLDYDGDLSFDANRFRRVIINLANNAKEAMSDGGEFTMAVSKNETNVLFNFSDNGPGIPEEIQETLFEVFVTKGKEKGTGLGMSTVKNIVEAHDGEISFETKVGEGTKFLVSLPIQKPE